LRRYQGEVMGGGTARVVWSRTLFTVVGLWLLSWLLG
jgi:hypothetical protein